MSFLDIDSPWVAFDDADPLGTDLFIVFSNANVNQGNFEFRSQVQNFPGNKLYLNCPDNSYYLKGIPGMGSTLKKLISSVSQTIKSEGYKSVYVLGAGMGGFAAMQLGTAIKADQVLVFSPELLLATPVSAAMKQLNTIAKSYQDNTDLPKLSPRTSYILFGSTSDLLDIYQLSQTAAHPNVHVYGLAGVRPGTLKDIRDTSTYQNLMHSFFSGETNPKKAWPSANPIASDKAIGEKLFNAKIAAGNGDWKTATPLLKAVIKKYPKADIALEQLGVYYLTVRDFPKAVGVFIECCKQNQFSTVYQERLAKALKSIGSNDPELWNLAGAAQAAKADRPAHIIGRTYLAEGDFEKAIFHLKAGIKSNPKNASISKLLALAYMKNNNFDAALGIQKKAVRRAPNDATAVHILGVIYSKSGSYRNAVKFLKQAYNMQPTHAGFAHQLAVALQHQKNHQEALPIIEKATKLKPDNIGFCLSAAEIANACGEWQKLFEFASSILQLDDMNADGHYYHGLALMNSNGDKAKARQDLQLALATNPNNPKYKKALARIS